MPYRWSGARGASSLRERSGEHHWVRTSDTSKSAGWPENHGPHEVRAPIGLRPTGLVALLLVVRGGGLQRKTLAKGSAVECELRRLGAIADAEDLVSGAEVLLHGGFGDEEALGYLGVAQPLAYQLEDLLLTRGKALEIYRPVVGHKILEQLPRSGDLAFRNHREGAHYLFGVHPGVD